MNTTILPVSVRMSSEGVLPKERGTIYLDERYEPKDFFHPDPESRQPKEDGTVLSEVNDEEIARVISEEQDLESGQHRYDACDEFLDHYRHLEKHPKFRMKKSHRKRKSTDSIEMKPVRRRVRPPRPSSAPLPVIAYDNDGNIVDATDGYHSGTEIYRDLPEINLRPATTFTPNSYYTSNNNNYQRQNYSPSYHYSYQTYPYQQRQPVRQDDDCCFGDMTMKQTCMCILLFIVCATSFSIMAYLSSNDPGVGRGTVMGTVTNSTLDNNCGYYSSSGTCYQVTIYYDYKVQQIEYNGSDTNNFSKKADATTYQDTYKIGDDIRVYYQTTNPKYSSLKPGSGDKDNGLALGMLATGMPLFSMLCCVAYYIKAKMSKCIHSIRNTQYSRECCRSHMRSCRDDFEECCGTCCAYFLIRCVFCQSID